MNVKSTVDNWFPRIATTVQCPQISENRAKEQFLHLFSLEKLEKLLKYVVFDVASCINNLPHINLCEIAGY